MRDTYGKTDVNRFIKKLAAEIKAEFSSTQPLNIIGVRTRGETLAQRLAAQLQKMGFAQIGRGVLDVTLYRDDLSEIGPKPLVRPTEIDINIDGQPLLLVDDVLFTGRSVRSALNALIDFGRPSAIRLAVLVDRGGRELPIQADYIGLKLKNIPPDQRVNVRLAEDDGKDEIVIEPMEEGT
jgi:pyrimidine operon attenuation protein / uracil phosphoribosyltransferase